MSTISDKLTQLNTIKGDIKTAINNKGGEVGNDFSTYATAINNLSTGGGSGETYTNPDFYELRTQNGTNYDHLFRGYNGPDIDVSQWDTSKVTSAQYCFGECTKSMDISNWDLSSLTNAQYMFGYSNTDYLDVRNIKLTGTKSYSTLFQYCYGTELDLSLWNISGVTELSNMCSYAKHKKINLTGWNTVNVISMSYVFINCINLETLLIPDFDMTNAKYTSSFLKNNRKLTYIDLSRSNDFTINKIASMLPSTAGTMIIPASTSQTAIDAVTAKGWTTSTEPTQ